MRAPAISFWIKDQPSALFGIIAGIKSTDSNRLWHGAGNYKNISLTQ